MLCSMTSRKIVARDLNQLQREVCETPYEALEIPALVVNGELLNHRVFEPRTLHWYCIG
jgi:hypothetical protein